MFLRRKNMKYIAFYKAKDDPKRNFCISYAVCEDNNSFIIKSFVEDGSFSEKAFIGNCGKEKAKEIAKLFAEKGVHPIHIENIISDMKF